MRIDRPATNVRSMSSSISWARFIAVNEKSPSIAAVSRSQAVTPRVYRPAASYTPLLINRAAHAATVAVRGTDVGAQNQNAFDKAPDAGTTGR